jgi:hypothetical protein
MIVRRAIAATVLVTACAFTPCALYAKKKPKPEKPPEISKIVSMVSNSLATACGADKCKTLSEIDLTLHTEVDKDGRVGVTIFGINFGGHREKDSYNEFSLKLALPTGNQVSPAAITSDQVSQKLVDALKNFADASMAAKSGKLPLEAQGFYLELGFTVVYGADANTSALSLVPVSPDISGKIDHKDVQTIRLTFGKS